MPSTTVLQQKLASCDKRRENILKRMMINDMSLDFYHNDPTKSAIRWDYNSGLSRLGNLGHLAEIELRQGIFLVVVIVHVPIFRRFISAFRRYKLDSVLRWHFLPSTASNNFRINTVMKRWKSVDIECDWHLFSSINWLYYRHIWEGGRRNLIKIALPHYNEKFDDNATSFITECFSLIWKSHIFCKTWCVCHVRCAEIGHLLWFRTQSWIVIRKCRESSFKWCFIRIVIDDVNKRSDNLDNVCDHFLKRETHIEAREWIVLSAYEKYRWTA